MKMEKFVGMQLSGKVTGLALIRCWLKQQDLGGNSTSFVWDKMTLILWQFHLQT
jgi:hypothetical protein